MSTCSGPSRASAAAKESLLQQGRLGSHCGTPTNPKPDGAARDPVVRRQYITQKMVDKHGVTPDCPRCEGRGTMSQSETCRKRFDAIEKKKLDEQLGETTRNAEPPLVRTEEDGSGAITGTSDSWSSLKLVWTGTIRSGGGTVAKSQFSCSKRPLEDDESSRKRVRSLAGMPSFDENDTSHWQQSIREAHTPDLSNEQQGPENTDHMQHPDTDIPGVWRCQVELKSDLNGDRTSKQLDPEKVVKGRLTELKHMNDHHVYDWIDEADIPKGTKIETSR